MTNNAPVHKLRLGYVTTAIWKNDDFYGVTISRNYKDSDGEWQSTDNLGHGDIMNAATLLERAEAWISDQ